MKKPNYVSDNIPCRQATSHAGMHDDFEIFWADKGDWHEKAGRCSAEPCEEGWYVGVPDCEGHIFGHFATSQEAFCQVLNAIDMVINASKSLN